MGKSIPRLYFTTKYHTVKCLIDTELLVHEHVKTDTYGFNQYVWFHMFGFVVCMSFVIL